MITDFPHGVSSFGGVIAPSTGVIHNGVGVDNGGSSLRPNKHFWVHGNLGNDGNVGRSPDRPLRTMAAVLQQVGSGDVVHMQGNFNENVTTPAGVFDVTLIGEGNLPRHADAHTTNNGYSSVTWGKSPASSTDPLLTVQQQGWRIGNILFECPASDAGILFYRDGGSGDAERDGGHGHVFNCRFDGGVNGGQEGIVVSGGSGFMVFENNLFRGLDDGIKTVTGAGIGTNSWWVIRNNRFFNNVDHIEAALDYATVQGNVSGRFTTQGFDLAGGTVGYNMVCGNYLSGDYDAAYVAGANDEWVGNFSMDVDSGEVGDNGISTAAPVA